MQGLSPTGSVFGAAGATIDKFGQRIHGIDGSQHYNLEHEHWTIRHDIYSHQFFDSVTAVPENAAYSRTRVVIHNPNQFNFLIRNKHFDDTIKSWFGMQDINCGYREFDKRFLVQSNDADMMKQIISDRIFQELLLKQEEVYLHVTSGKEWLEEASDEDAVICFFQSDVPEVMKDIEQLFLLMIRSLELLKKADPIFNTKPSTQLTAPDE